MLKYMHPMYANGHPGRPHQHSISIGASMPPIYLLSCSCAIAWDPAFFKLVRRSHNVGLS